MESVGSCTENSHFQGGIYVLTFARQCQATSLPSFLDLGCTRLGIVRVENTLQEMEIAENFKIILYHQGSCKLF